MPQNRDFCLTLACAFLSLSLPAGAATVNATWNTTTDVPVTAGSYTATGNTVNFTLNFAPATGTNLTVVNNTGLPFINGTFDNLAQGQAVALSFEGETYSYVAHYFGGSGNDLVLVWANNRIMAWGNNSSGQLGDSSTTQRLVSVPVTATGVLAGKTILSLASGGSHCVALCSDGTVATWGDNTYGQLGNSGWLSSTVPVAVTISAALSDKKVVAVAAGSYHCLALCSDGTVAAWGQGNFDALGNNNTNSQNYPVAVSTAGGVSALNSKTVVAIAAGTSHSMALCSDGTIAAWGWNLHGQVGNNSTDFARVPVAVNTDSGVSALYGKTAVSITAGNSYSLAICSDGTLTAWGGNSYGQLGNSSTADSWVPVVVDTTSGASALQGKTISALYAGSGSVLALCTDGMLAAWGNNTNGQLGINSLTSSSVPVAVSVDNGVSALHNRTVFGIASGALYNLALCSDGSLAAWGDNTYGQLGINSTTGSKVPVLVGTSALASGEFFANGAVGCACSYAAVIVAEPAQPATTTRAADTITATGATLNGVEIAAGYNASLSFDYGTSTSYGMNVAGTPATASGGTAIETSAVLTGLTPGTTYHYRLKSVGGAGTFYGDDQTFTTPNNDASLAGLVMSIVSINPEFSSEITSYTAVVPGSTTSVKLTPTLANNTATMKVNGVSVASGSASQSINLSLGDNIITTVITAEDGTTMQTYTVMVTRSTPNPLPADYTSEATVPLTVQSFTATGSTVNFSLSYAPAIGGSLMVVKNAGVGFIHGTFDNLAQGQRVTMDFNGATYTYVANYYGGTGNDLVLQWADRHAFATGYNSNGQLGTNSYSSSNVPVPVTATGVLAGKTITSLAAGLYHSLALCSDGTLAAWGDNYSGKLGNNSTSYSSTVPVAVDRTSGLSSLYGKTVVAIAAGSNHSMALCSDGTVSVWGSNASGQLGNNGSTGSSVPVAVSTSSGVSALHGKTVVAIAAGASHCLALCSDGTLAAWGANDSGQIGSNSTTSFYNAPVAVNTDNGVSYLYGKTVSSIAAGGAHNLVLCTDGSMAAWGNNASRQSGSMFTGQKLYKPVWVQNNYGTALYVKTVIAVSAGSSHCMALCSDGTVAAWGNNYYGQLGNNSTTTSSTPVVINTASGVSGLYGKTVIAITAGSNHSWALCSDGTAAAWGYNNHGQLGINSTTSSSVPVTVNRGLESLVDVSVGPVSSHTLVMVATPSPSLTTQAADMIRSTGATLNGTVNANDGIGVTCSFEYGTTTNYGRSVAATPGSVTGGNDTAVTATITGLTPNTTYHFRLTNGDFQGADQVFTTINNDASLADLVTSTGNLSPEFSSTVTSYSIGGVSYATAAITVTPTLSDSNATMTVNGVSVASGSASPPVSLMYGSNLIHVQVTAQDGVTNQDYILAVTRLIPATIDATFNSDSSIALTTNECTATGSTVNFTLNFAPATGTNLTVVNNTGLPFINGTFDNLTQGQLVPLTCNGVTYQFVANYFGGTGNDLVLVWAGNRAFGWGYNYYGKIGDGTTTQRNVMVPVTMTGVLAGKTIISLAQNSYHSLALCSDGTIASWGYNSYGQLGNNSTTNSSVPVAVNAENGVSALYGKTVVAVAAGYYHSMALCSDGTIATWGYNSSGQLGDTTTTSSSVPVAVTADEGVSALSGRTAVAIAAGYKHSMAVCSDGTVVAWGYNYYGQLGDNTTTQRNAPVLVNNSSGGSALSGRSVTTIAAGYYHCMALCSDGTLVAWGYNYNGMLGDNTTTHRSLPVAVNTTSGVSAISGKTVTSIAAGYYHSMALCSDGTVAAWGYDYNGQLGNDTATTSSYVPVAVNTDAGVSALHGKFVVAIVAGGHSGHISGALCSDGSMAAWGYNSEGDLGNNSTTESHVPVALDTSPLQAGEILVRPSNGTVTAPCMALVAEPPSGATTLAAVLLSGSSAELNGVVSAFDSVNVSFDYGTTTAYGSSIAASPATLTGNIPTAVTATLTGLMPLTTYHFRVNDGVHAGDDLSFTTPNNDASLASLASSSGSLSPVFSSGTTSYVTPSVLESTSSITLTPALSDSQATMTINGVSAVSGSPFVVNLGHGTNTIRLKVIAQDGVTTQTYTLSVDRPLPAVIDASYTAGSDVPLTSNALIHALGVNVSFTLSYTPVTGANLMVVNNTGLDFIDGTFDNLAQGQAVALSYAGVNYRYVANYYGGTGNDLVLVWANNRAVAWGYNTGNLGDGTTTIRSLPAPIDSSGVLAGRTIVSTAAGAYHALALCSDGTVAAWGRNSSGQLGDKSYTQRAVPVLVNTDAGVSALAGKTVVALAAGDYHSLALCSDGTVVAWGGNSSGELGNNTTTDSNVPLVVSTDGAVSALAGKAVAAIAAGGSFSMALCTDGSVVAWGDNYYGQLGDNTTTQRNAPVSVNTDSGVSALHDRPVVALAAGNDHSLALCADGTVAAWGNNSDGRLGDNSTTKRMVPVSVNTDSGVSALAGKTVVDLAAGDYHSLALCSDGTVVAWGYNYNGQLGDNTTTQRNVPVSVNTDSGVSALAGKTVVSLAAGYHHSLALCSDGTLAAWGNNYYGGIGDDTTTNRNAPVQVNTRLMATGEAFGMLPVSQGTYYWSLAVAATPAYATVGTQAASDIGGTSATLNGLVVAASDSMAVSFEYGTTSGYGTTLSAVPALVSNDTITPVSAVIPELTPGTTYHFRITGVNSVSTLLGDDLTFTTLNNNPDLASLALDTGTLSPAFASTTTSYTLSVPYETPALILTPGLADSNASIQINGVPVDATLPSWPIPLLEGSNTITLLVTAEDGTTTKTYTLNVTRGTGPSLTSLGLDSGALNPGFDPNTTRYTVNVSSATSTITLTPTVMDGTTTVQVNGITVASGSASAPISLVYGDTTTTTTVTSQDATLNKTYTVLVTRDIPATFAAALDSASTIPLTTHGLTATGRSLSVTLNYAPVTGANLLLVNNTSAGFISGTFDNLAQGQLVALDYNGVTYHFRVNYFGGNGNDLVLQWADNRVFAWGSNSYSQLGSLYPSTSPLPVTTSPGSLGQRSVQSLAAGANHSLALCWDGTLIAWGNGVYGQLGIGMLTSALRVPYRVDTFSDTSSLKDKSVVAISAGGYHTLALCSDGTVSAWGYNNRGQVGVSPLVSQPYFSPTAVDTTGGVSALNGKTVTAISSGIYHNLALCSDGTLAAWGYNHYGQLGNSSLEDSQIPVPVNASAGVSALYGKTVVAIAAGGYHNLALCSDGTLVAWGYNHYGQLGDNNTTTQLVPVAVNTAAGISALQGKTVVAVAAGCYHSMALCSDGMIASWGYNSEGQLGDNTTISRKAPVQVNASSGLSSLYGKTVTGITAGVNFNVAVCSDGTLNVWGSNSTRQLGITSYVPPPQKTPIQIIISQAASAELFASPVTSPGSYHSLALVATPPATVMSTPATAVTSSGAILNGAVNASNGYVPVSFDYGLTSSYGRNQAGAQFSVTGLTPRSTSVELTGLLPSTTYHFRANGGSYSGSDLTFTTLSLLQDWRQTHFGSNDNTGTTADDADFDNDGIPNLIEWACHLDPTTRSTLPITTAGDGANFEYTYTRSSAAATGGATFTVEWSNTLAPGTWSSTGVTQTLLSDDGTTQQVKAVIPINAASAKFVRLSITAPP